MSNFTCALSGQNPISDPVALPTGEICSKALLLKKLLETSNHNPFHPSSQLDETQLITLATSNEILPPRNANQNSIPSILNTLNSEYDSLVLELFDTRKALEETRKELSHALYQNDAAVRVIARVVMERDMARRELADAIANGGAAPASANGESTGNKRKRVEEPEEASADKSSSGIPANVKAELQATWKELNSTRKQKTKAGEGYATADDIAAFKAEKKSYHKTSAKGIVAMVGDVNGNKLVTSSTDRHMTLYNLEDDKVISHVAAKAVAGNEHMLHCVGNTVAMVDADGAVKIYNGDTELSVSVEVSDVVAIKVHPTGNHVFVAEKSGLIHLLEIVDGEKVNEAATWSTLENESDVTCSSMGIHPDGLILVIGRSDGKISLWDLNTEMLAATMGGSSSPIFSIDFSEKGVHIAAVDESGNLSVWDLRKQKSIASMNAEGGITSVCFCPVGKYLAYGTSSGDIIVTVVKDWDKKIVLSDGKGKITGLVWGKDAKHVVGTQSTSRMVKVWG